MLHVDSNSLHPSTSPTTPKFHIGLTMAGGVTSGAYTAGVLDYILETIERWERLKSSVRAQESSHGLSPEGRPTHDVPMHNVVLELFNGTSAGGICAAVATLMLAKGIDPEEIAQKRSLLYKLWVEMDDDARSTTLHKMLDTDDLRNDKLESLLNSKPIQDLAERLIQPVHNQNWPAYVSMNFDTILTVSNLIGSELKISFRSDGEERNHYMPFHRDYIHFKPRNSVTPEPHIVPSDLSSPSDIERLRNTAMSTCAFPLGFVSRNITRNKETYKAMVTNTLAIATDTNNHVEDIEVLLPDNSSFIYESLNVDGGALNNEPFGEAAAILAKRAGHGRNEPLKSKDTSYATLLIDPFPARQRTTKPSDCSEELPPFYPKHTEKELMTVAPNILSMLRNQVKFKEKDLLAAIFEDDFTRYMMAPSNGDDQRPLCTGEMGGFFGLLSRGFREHDYELGRKNAESFLTKYFSLEYEPDTQNVNAIHTRQVWSDAAYAKYLFTDDDKFYLPIIPNVTTMQHYANVSSSIRIEKPTVQKVTKRDIILIKKLLKPRVQALLNNLDLPDPECPLKEEVNRMLRKDFKIKKPSLIEKLSTRLFRNRVLGGVAKKITNDVIVRIVYILDKREWLDTSR